MLLERVSPARVLRMSGVALLVAVALTACFPSTYIEDPMPMSIHRDASGALTVSFPVCRGDRVQSAGVGTRLTEGYVVLRYGPAEHAQKRATIESFVVDEEAVADRRLDVPWPVSETWPEGAVGSLADITSVWASTTGERAGFDVASLAPAGTGDWVVIGDRISHDALPVATSAAEAKAAVEAFCEE